MTLMNWPYQGQYDVLCDLKCLGVQSSLEFIENSGSSSLECARAHIHNASARRGGVDRMCAVFCVLFLVPSLCLLN